MQRRSTIVLSILIAGAGIALVVETALLGGGIGFFLGAVLIAAGAGRLYVSSR